MHALISLAVMSGGALSLRPRRHLEVGADGRGGDHGDEGEDNRCICDGKGPAGTRRPLY